MTFAIKTQHSLKRAKKNLFGQRCRLRNLSCKHGSFLIEKKEQLKSVDTKAMENYSQEAVLGTNQRADGMCPVEFQNLYEPVPAVCVYAISPFFK